METWLKAKTAGLPRWAWLAGLSGAVILGLYLRSRNQSNEEEETGPGESAEYYGEEGGFGGSGEGGLAGAGVLGGGTGTTTTPVQTPYIPEGFTEMFGQLTELVRSQSEQESTLAQVIAEARGGGAPEPGLHEAPAPSPGPYTPTTTTPTKPKPTCPQNVKNKIASNSNEMDRLQGEINNLQNEISQLTSNIQAHPKANQRPQWEAQRNQDQNNIQGKRNKVQALSDENGRLRQTAGCS